MTTAEGTFNLRPRTIGELLDQAIRLYRNNFLTFLGIIALMQIPLALIQLAINYFTLWNPGGELGPMGDSLYVDPSMLALAGAMSNFVIAIVQLLLVNGIAAAALTRAIGNSFLGEKVGVLDAYRRVSKSLVSVVGAILLLVLLSIPLVVWTLVPCVGWLTGPGVMMFLWWMVLPLIAPAVVLERRKAWNAIGRAWTLVMKRFWWLLGFNLILWTFSFLVVIGPVLLVSLFFQSQVLDSFAASGVGQYSTLEFVVQTLISMVLGLLVFPVQSAGFILAYFDLRTRFEGFDLALLTRQAEGGETEAGELAALGLHPDQKIHIGANEIGYFIGLSLILFAIYAALMAVMIGIFALFAGPMGL